MGFFSKMFEVAVVISAVDQITGPMEKMASQMGILDKRSQELQQRINGFRNMAFVGGAITAAGLAMTKTMEQGVDQAGEFLSKMVVIRDTVGATADQMERIKKVIQNSSGKTIFGAMQTADFAKLLATSGMSASQIIKTLPVFTQYAEVQQLGKGTSPEESIQQAISAAHMVGAYDPQSLLRFLDMYNKATFMQPGSSSEFADTFKYLAPTGSSLGMSTNDMLFLAALSNRVGLAGSMGGTNAADMILRSIPGLFRGKKQPEALRALGLDKTIFDRSGHFLGVENFIEQLGKASAGRNPQELARYYHDIFGMQGMRLAEILSSPRGQDQLKAIEQQMKTMKSISKMQEDTNKSPQGQALQMQTNMENLKLNVWIELAQTLNPVVHDLNDIISDLLKFQQAHPWVSKVASAVMLLATGAALTVGPFLVIKGVLGYIAATKAIATTLQMISAAFTGGAASATEAAAAETAESVANGEVAASASAASVANEEEAASFNAVTVAAGEASAGESAAAAAGAESAASSTAAAAAAGESAAAYSTAAAAAGESAAGASAAAAASGEATAAAGGLAGTFGAIGESATAALGPLALFAAAALLIYINWNKLKNIPFFNPKVHVSSAQDMIDYQNKKFNDEIKDAVQNHVSGPLPSEMLTRTPLSGPSYKIMGLSSGTGHTTVNKIEKGAIVVNGAGKNAKQVAGEVVKQLGTKTRHASYARADALTPSF